jgi:hypothetical protein
VDGREGARARALLGLGVARARRALGAREDAALREDEDVAVRELLLKLAGEAGGERVRGKTLIAGFRLDKTYRCWTRWKPCREGTGTKMTIAFLPWPTSI